MNNLQIFLEQTNKKIINEAYGELWMYLKQMRPEEIKEISKILTTFGLDINAGTFTPVELESNRDMKLKDPNVIVFWVVNYVKRGTNEDYFSIPLITKNKEVIYKNHEHYATIKTKKEVFKDVDNKLVFSKLPVTSLMNYVYKVFYVDITESPYDTAKRLQRFENQKNAVALERENELKEYKKLLTTKLGGNFSWEDYVNFKTPYNLLQSPRKIIDKSGYKNDLNKYKKMLADIKANNMTSAGNAEKYVKIMLDYQNKFIDYQNKEINNDDMKLVKEYYNKLTDMSFSIAKLGGYLNEILFSIKLLSTRIKNGYDEFVERMKNKNLVPMSKEEFNSLYIEDEKLELRKRIEIFEGLSKSIKEIETELEKILNKLN